MNQSLGADAVLPLNTIDHIVRKFDARARDAGFGAYICQAMIWLKERVDADELRRALATLNARYPVLTSRLEFSRTGGGWCWVCRPGAALELEVIDLTSAGEAQQWSEAERLLNSQPDPRNANPVSWHLLRGPHRDLIVLLWSHVLFDGKAGEALLTELNRAYCDVDVARAGLNAGIVVDNCEPMSHFPGVRWSARLRSLVHFIWHHSPGGRPALFLARPLRRFIPDPAPNRVVVRSLSEEETQRFNQRVRRLCGFPNPSPVLLASAFRGLAKLSPMPRTRRSIAYVLMPVNLRAGSPLQPVFGNHQCYLKQRAAFSELEDCDRLAKSLHAQLRGQVRERFDLGMLQSLAILNRLPAPLIHWLQRRMAGISSFAYGYHGDLPAGLNMFCGTDVDEIYLGIPGAVAPPGLVLAAHQHRGRLNLMVSFAPDAVAADIVEKFLRFVQDDIQDASPQPDPDSAAPMKHPETVALR
jgi:hypothetical protein